MMMSRSTMSESLRMNILYGCLWGGFFVYEMGRKRASRSEDDMVTLISTAFHFMTCVLVSKCDGSNDSVKQKIGPNEIEFSSFEALLLW